MISILILGFCRLLDGVSGVVTIDKFDASEFPTRFGGQIKDFNVEG